MIDYSNYEDLLQQLISLEYSCYVQILHNGVFNNFKITMAFLTIAFLRWRFLRHIFIIAINYSINFEIKLFYLGVQIIEEQWFTKTIVPIYSYKTAQV